MKSASFLESEKLLYVFAIIASLILSVWMAYRETTVNTDAICYLLSAETMSTQGFHHAMNLCGQARWPFYSFLIYLFTQVTHFSYLVSAYTLNSFFSLLSVIFFVLIVKELGGTKRILWFALGVFLLSHELNSVREYIIRDHGYWTFYLSSILFLLRFFKQYDPRASKSFVKQHGFNAFGFSFSLAIATLFRVEGALFLLFLPLLTFLCFQMTWKERIQSFFMLNALTILMSVALSIWIILHHEQSLEKFGRLIEIPQHLHRGWLLMLGRFEVMRDALLKDVLIFSTKNEGSLVLILVMLSWFLLRVISNLSFAYAFLVCSAWMKKLIQPFSDKLVLFGYIMINCFTTFGFLAENSFISKRYLIALSLVLMLFVPFALDDLLSKTFTTPARKRWNLGLIILFGLIFISSIGGIFDFGYSKAYVRSAGNWLQKNIPQNASLYTNDISLMYYSKHFDTQIFEKMNEYTKDKIVEEQLKQYDFIALRLGADSLAKHTKKGMTASNDDLFEKVQQMGVKPIQVFTNKRGDRVLIFKLSAHSLETA